MFGVALLTSTLLALADARIYERCELARDLLSLGIRKEHIATWVCIAYHESRFDTAARNPSSGDHGLLQISELYWCGVGKACGLPCSALRDEDISDDVECALRIHEEHTRLQGNGFLAWVVYPQHCKHNAKKYLADCDSSVKTSSARTYSGRGRIIKSQTSNFSTSPFNPKIDELLPPYLTVGSFLRGSYEKEFEENYNNKVRINWLNYKIDNIDDLKLPVFNQKVRGQYKTTAYDYSSTTTTTTTTEPPLPKIKPPSPRRIESNSFRRRKLRPIDESIKLGITTDLPLSSTSVLSTTGTPQNVYKSTESYATKQNLLHSTTTSLPHLKSKTTVKTLEKNVELLSVSTTTTTSYTTQTTKRPDVNSTTPQKTASEIVLRNSSDEKFSTVTPKQTEESPMLPLNDSRQKFTSKSITSRVSEDIVRPKTLAENENSVPENKTNTVTSHIASKNDSFKFEYPKIQLISSTPRSWPSWKTTSSATTPKPFKIAWRTPKSLSSRGSEMLNSDITTTIASKQSTTSKPQAVTILPLDSEVMSLQPVLYTTVTGVKLENFTTVTPRTSFRVANRGSTASPVSIPSSTVLPSINSETTTPSTNRQNKSSTLSPSTVHLRNFVPRITSTPQATTGSSIKNLSTLRSTNAILSTNTVTSTALPFKATSEKSPSTVRSSTVSLSRKWITSTPLPARRKAISTSRPSAVRSTKAMTSISTTMPTSFPTTNRPIFTNAPTAVPSTNITSSISTVKSTPLPTTVRTTQSIFDLYLNPTKRPKLPVYKNLFKNSAFSLRIFDGGTTTRSPSMLQLTASNVTTVDAVNKKIRRQVW